MTVVVGILNKKGVAIAADSATTNDMKNDSTGEKNSEEEAFVDGVSACEGYAEV